MVIIWAKFYDYDWLMLMAAVLLDGATATYSAYELFNTSSIVGGCWSRGNWVWVSFFSGEVKNVRNSINH